ncbi:uncharacterized protein LOC107479633 [Arachis duranensis]|uniref:ATP-dependent DNA helicase n=1 Tax=Arachis duranensis TaxID=130453 RepID=A0A6P4CQ52_ARADU|nr:uncharacterized protein LOC107479633 [Arachis duranensis]
MSEGTQVVDEIRNHYDCRYISACEVVWRLFGYEIQEKEPFVVRLPFHLEDEQPVVYSETSNVNDIVERAVSHKSMFLAWMSANISYPYTRSLTYAEFPTKFFWKDDTSKWFPRKQGFIIGRLTHLLAELTMSYDEIKQLCLMDIDKILHSSSKILKDYPPIPLTTEVDSSLLIERVFFFVYGHGGTGKIFIWNLMSAEIRSRGDIVLNVASSGIASLLLHNEALDKCLGDIMRFYPTYNKDLPFGGKVVVLGGDFRQILPVVPRGSRQDIVHSIVNLSYLWKFCQVLKQIKNMRLSVEMTASDQDEIEQFGEWLLKVGVGLIGDNMDGESEICLPGDIVIPSSDQAFDELVHFSYPNILDNMSLKDFFKTRTILAPMLEIIAEVNNHLMAIIPGREKLYLSSNSIGMDEGNMESQLDLYGLELLNSINCSSLPPPKLILKVGVLVMLLSNIDQSSGLCNGTRLQVRKLGNHVIECEVLTSNNVGHIALILRMNMVPINETLPVRFQ